MSVTKQALKVRKENGGQIQTEEQESDKDEGKYIQTLEMNLMSEGLPDPSFMIKSLLLKQSLI